MKMLLQGILFLMLICIETSCTPSKQNEVGINETKKEKVYDKQDNAIFETNIQFEPLIFTAGKVWLEHIEKSIWMKCWNKKPAHLPWEQSTSI